MALIINKIEWEKGGENEKEIWIINFRLKGKEGGEKTGKR